MDTRPIRLTVNQPNLAPLKIDAQGPTITLGRATDCTIPIKDRYLSRKHAEIIYASGQWAVRDCGSVNGTLLNGTKLTAVTPLKPGDRIVLGDSEVVFEPEESTSQSQLIALDMLSAYGPNIMNPAVGARFRKEILSRGGELPASQLVRNFLGREPKGDAFFAEITGKKR